MQSTPYLRINFDKYSKSKQISFEEIVEALTHEIKTYNNLNGCRLPSVRALAHQLNVSKNIIEKAYDELKSRNLVISKNRQGLYIHNPKLKISETSKKNVPYLRLKSFDTIPMNIKKNDMISLSSVFIDPRLLPTKRLTECFKSCLKNPGLDSSYDLSGYWPLREIIAERLVKRGIDAKAADVITTIGSQGGLDLVSRTIESGIVATENPSYAAGKKLFELNGNKTVGLPISPFLGVNLKTWERLILENKPDLLYLTSNFQNPNGYSYTTEEMEKIILLAEKYNIGILEDDWGSEMMSYTDFKPGFRAQAGESVLYMNSFTKKLLPSLRLGYLLANNKSTETFLNAKRVSILGNPLIIEKVVFEFLDRGYYDHHLKKTQEILDKRYHNVLNLLFEFMPSEVKWTKPGGGPVLWVELPKRVSIQKLSQKLLQDNIIIQDSNIAFFDKPLSHGFKVGYAFLNEEEITNAIEKLSQGIKELM